MFLELWILVDPLYIYYVFEVPKFPSFKKIPDFENSHKGNCMAAKSSTEFKLPLRLSHEGVRATLLIGSQRAVSVCLRYPIPVGHCQ